MQAINTKSEYFQKLRLAYISKQFIDHQLSDFIEKEVSNQSDNLLMKKLHNGYIASSVFGELCHKGDETSLISICKCLIGYTNVSGSRSPADLARHIGRVNRL